MPKRKDTRSKIKDAALELFSKYGYSGGSVRDIGKKAGVRESALYNYFTSKNKILEELINDAIKASDNKELLTDDLLDTISNPKIFIKKFVTLLLNKWNEEKQREYLKLILVEQFRNKHDGVSLDLLISDTINIWDMIFSQMLNFKLIKKNNSKIIATEFVYPLFMLRLQYLLSNDSNIKTALIKADEHVEYFWKSIKR